MILPLAFLYTPQPPVPFPDEFQGVWDQNSYACAQAETPSRLAISKSNFVNREFQGYATGFSRLNGKVIVAGVLGGDSKATSSSLQRLELSEDGATLFVQSYAKTERKETATARIFVRCPDPEKAMEGLS